MVSRDVALPVVVEEAVEPAEYLMTTTDTITIPLVTEEAISVPIPITPRILTLRKRRGPPLLVRMHLSYQAPVFPGRIVHPMHLLGMVATMIFGAAGLFFAGYAASLVFGSP